MYHYICLSQNLKNAIAAVARFEHKAWIERDLGPDNAQSTASLQGWASHVLGQAIAICTRFQLLELLDTEMSKVRLRFSSAFFCVPERFKLMTSV